MSDIDIDIDPSPSCMRARHHRHAGAAGIAHALCVHGAGGGAWEWTVWRGVLEAHGIECRTIELRPAVDGLTATGFGDYRRQVRAALDAMPRPRVVIGASLGGLLALACADGADALVLINPLPPAPWASRLPERAWPDVVRWGTNARLASTRRALPDADEATAIDAVRRWRDESGRVLREAQAGLEVPPPRVPVLCIASGLDEDVPLALTADLASAFDAELMRLPHASHVGPLLGRDAAHTAVRTVQWLQAR